MTEVPSRRAPGTPCWASLTAQRVDRAQDFYGTLFGWEFEPGPPQPGGYVLAVLDGRRIAGIGGGSTEPHRPVAWTTMLAADDVDRAAARVRECGGTVGMGPLNAGDLGRLAIALDPSGAVFGIRQGEGRPGPDLTGAPGTLAWHELVTRETAPIAAFYQEVFGYGTEPSPDGRADRLLLTVSGLPMAGVHGVGRRLRRDLGAHWRVYFEVADVLATTARATELGGRVVEAPRESADGRAATLTDPEGAAFSVIAGAGR